MKKIIIILLLYFGFTNDFFAYPISPRPLRKLVMESEHIIVGYVIKTYEKNSNKESYYGSKIAQILILENLQNKICKDTIEIEFEPNMICPSPDRYFDKTYVISFIDKKNGKFHTHALSYGAKTLKKEEIEIYKKRISEIQDILKIDDEEKQKEETIEWLVKCAENETTRWEGTFELSPESSFMSYYSKDKKENFKEMISPEQKERLKKVLLESNETNFGLVDLVYKNNETIIDNFLLNQLKKLNEDYYYFIADEFMRRLKHKNTSDETDKILAKFEEIQFESEKKEELKTLVINFIKLVEK